MTAQQPEDHIKNPYTLAEIKTKIASNDYNAEMLLQHAMLLLEKPAAVAGPSLYQVMAVAKAIHATTQDADDWDSLRQWEVDALRRRAEKVLAAQAAPAAQGDAEDAARYRWLRRWKGQEHEPPFTVQHEVDGTLWGGDLDAAVDAARKQGANHD